MAKIKETLTWKERLIQEASSIVRHGRGKLELQVGPTGTDRTNILVVSGRTFQFLIDRDVLLDD